MEEVHKSLTGFLNKRQLLNDALSCLKAFNIPPHPLINLQRCDDLNLSLFMTKPFYSYIGESVQDCGI